MKFGENWEMGREMGREMGWKRDRRKRRVSFGEVRIELGLYKNLE